VATLRASDLTCSELLQLLKELTPPSGETVRCWLEAFDGWALDSWRGFGAKVRWNRAGQDPREEPLADLLPRVTFGRIFSPSGELKWRQLPALGERCCRVVFLGQWDGPALERLPVREELAFLRPGKVEYPLWGQQTAQTPGEWIDLRIPHRLRYPVVTETPTEGRLIAYLKVELWKDERGEPQFVRLCDLTARWEE
jgi:hypothetical protein